MDLESAARALGVHYQTAYRWVRAGVLPAVKVAGGYRLTAEDVECLARSRRSHRPLSYTGRTRDWERLREQLYLSLATGEETGARRVFERLQLARVPILEQCEQLVVPTIRRFADEAPLRGVPGPWLRLAAGICERNLAWAARRLNRPGQGSAMVVTPASDDHRLPSVMAAAVLRDGGWAVCELHGVDADKTADVVREVRPSFAVVSVTVREATEEAAAIGEHLARRLGVPSIVGGPGRPLTEVCTFAATIGGRALTPDAQPPAA